MNLKIQVVSEKPGKESAIRPEERKEIREIAEAILEQATKAPEGKYIQSPVGKISGKVVTIINNKAAYRCLPFKASTEKGSGVVVVKKIPLSEEAKNKKRQLLEAVVRQQAARKKAQIQAVKIKAMEAAVAYEVAVQTGKADI